MIETDRSSGYGEIRNKKNATLFDCAAVGKVGKIYCAGVGVGTNESP